LFNVLPTLAVQKSDSCTNCNLLKVFRGFEEFVAVISRENERERDGRARPVSEVRAAFAHSHHARQLSRLTVTATVNDAQPQQPSWRQTPYFVHLSLFLSHRLAIWDIR
jgi:hypothetical protein